MSDDERTVIRPRPGGRPRGGTPQSPATRVPETAATVLPVVGAGLNPLVDAATALLSLVSQLRNAASHPDVAGLRNQVVEGVTRFEDQAMGAGLTQETVFAARYCLCTVLDEAVLITPWGSESPWSHHSLLSSFHNETWGGEKFFKILERMALEPARHLEMLELLYVCLALGFEGKYRVMERGRNKLEEVRDNLYRTIRGQRGEFERDLSPHWRGEQQRRKALTHYVPLWVIGAVAGVVLIGIYIGFRVTLNDGAYPVYAELDGIGRKPLAPVVQAAPAPAPAAKPVVPRLAKFLAPEVKQGLVTVEEDARSSTVMIRGDGLFASGRAQVKAEYVPVLIRIAEALNEVPGQVLVTGHTDNVPMRSLRFASNWDLSRQRADSVVQVLSGRVTAVGRLHAEGRADTEPVVPNDTPEHRAQNRRVVITLTRSAEL